MNEHAMYGRHTLAPGIRSRCIEGVNGLSMHILEAGDDSPERPCVLLLHGFPELGYSWRKQLPELARAGFYVVAPDQRGFGRTTGWRAGFDDDVSPFGMYNLAMDVLALVYALGRRSVTTLVGHDFGSAVAGFCALIRPDVFRSVVLMSAPFGDPPGFDAVPRDATRSMGTGGLATLAPPRKHYQVYFSGREADEEMRNAPQGLHAFLRGYYHVKSADWAANRPEPLPDAGAPSLARLPRYYVMDQDRNMPETISDLAPWRADLDACDWLTSDELSVYVEQFAATGFQGGLNWYRGVADPGCIRPLRMFAGRTIDVPSCYIAGQSDWGIYQAPGRFERMQSQVCTQMTGVHLVPGAGHWVQQEQPAHTNRLLIDFAERNANTPLNGPRAV